MTSYVINDVPLIFQDNNNACWYAGFLMLVAWRRARGRGAVVPNDLDSEAQRHRRNDALPWEAVRRIAFELNLVPVPTSTPVPYPHRLEEWLRQYGPLWTGGIAVDWAGHQVGPGHAVVVAGVSHSDSPEMVYVLDPWPMGRGREGWRPFAHLTTILSGRHDFLHYRGA